MFKSRTFLTAGITAAIVVFGYSAHVLATAVNSNSVSAQIVTPISVATGTALTFGIVSNDPALTSTVTIVPVDNSLSTTNGASAISGQTRADFTLSGGTAAATYTVNFTTYPGDITATGCGACPANSVTINTLTWASNSLGASSGQLDGLGGDTVWVGGTLTMTNAAAAGNYTGSYDMDVVYN